MLLFLFDNTLPKIYEIAKPIINITIPIRTSLKQEIDNIAFLIIIIIEIIKGSPVKPELENKIHAIGLMVLLLLMLLVTFNDIIKLF